MLHDYLHQMLTSEYDPKKLLNEAWFKSVFKDNPKVSTLLKDAFPTEDIQYDRDFINLFDSEGIFLKLLERWKGTSFFHNEFFEYEPCLKGGAKLKRYEFKYLLSKIEMTTTTFFDVRPEDGSHPDFLSFNCAEKYLELKQENSNESPDSETMELVGFKKDARHATKAMIQAGAYLVSRHLKNSQEKITAQELLDHPFVKETRQILEKYSNLLDFRVAGSKKNSVKDKGNERTIKEWVEELL